MTAIQDVAKSGAAAQKAAAPSAIEQGQDRFLKLLVTQMRNQDPLNPLDNAQVTSQMAQISTVNGIDKLNATISNMSASFLSAQSLQAAAMIGHGVLAPGNKLPLENGLALGGALLAEPADKVRVTIRGAAGEVLQTMDLGAKPQGTLVFQWDGVTDSGAQLANGSYSFEVKAVRGDQSVPAEALGFGQVGSVSLGDKELLLNVSTLGAIGMKQVKQIL